ncbi:MAG: tetratricopeptide repeat protein [Nitrospirae bacterium]|nr:tetratricopeptide repeat protein [Nitrospirota bacterium]
MKLLQNTITARVHSLGLTNFSQYYNLIEGHSNQSADEWNILIETLTTGESYFFRDRGQFEILRSHIFPDLIRRKTGQRTLRIWSAGCATGEETYSIAIELYEMLMHIRHFNVFIIGTDINQKAIERARLGFYNDWSFRMVEPEIKLRYFFRKGSGWMLDKQIRDMVTFKTGNLVKDIYPQQGTDLYDMDLIVCRNVFIYFDKDTVTSIIEKFANTLNEDGYLITGHAELYTVNIGVLKSFMHPSSIIYQKVSGPAADEGASSHLYRPTPAKGNVIDDNLINIPGYAGTSTPLISTSIHGRDVIDKNSTYKEPAPPTSAAHTPESLLSDAVSFYKKGMYSAAIERASSVLKFEPDNLAAIGFLARTYANTGDYAQSSKWCEKAIHLNPLEVTSYFVLAQIAENKGQIEKAKELYNKIMYLEPSFVPAYIELGALYERENDQTKAIKMRKSAVELLRKLPQDKTVEPYDEYTVKELLEYVLKLYPL